VTDRRDEPGLGPRSPATSVPIRPATPEDGPALQQIERLAGERFRDVGRPEIAEHEPASLHELGAYASDGRAWVALDEAGAPTGHVLVDVVDGNAHIEQVSVIPAWQGRGVGRALVDQVGAWATVAGLPAITLTTFTDVPWNGPLYRHLGFRDLAEEELGPELRAVRDAEAAHGLDPRQRVCMRLDLATRG
jgi:GNAT superfamily N-acetyltransferase